MSHKGMDMVQNLGGGGGTRIYVEDNIEVQSEEIDKGQPGYLSSSGSKI